MNITLRSDLEKKVRERVECGEYESADALVQEAVQRLMEQDATDSGNLTVALQEGFDDLDRGNFTDYDEHNINDLANDVHERGLQRLAERRTTGKRK